jgi:hypothetical protein
MSIQRVPTHSSILKSSHPSRSEQDLLTTNFSLVDGIELHLNQRQFSDLADREFT